MTNFQVMFCGASDYQSTYVCVHICIFIHISELYSNNTPLLCQKPFLYFTCQSQTLTEYSKWESFLSFILMRMLFSLKWNVCHANIAIMPVQDFHRSHQLYWIFPTHTSTTSTAAATTVTLELEFHVGCRWE